MKSILRLLLLLFLALINVDQLFAQWQSIGPFGTAYNTILKFDPFGSGRLYASGGGSLFRSDNSGVLWKNITPPVGPMSGECGLAISASTPGEIYAVSSWNIYRSTDYGDNWTLYYSDSSRVIAFLDKLNPKHLLSYVSRGSGFSGGYVQTMTQSTDGGEHWQTTVNGIDTTMGPVQVWVNPNFPHIMFALQWISYGGDVVVGYNSFRTSDGAAHWENLNLDIHQSYTDLVFDPLDSNVVYSRSISKQWMKSTDDGLSWNELGNGIPAGNLGHLFISSANSDVIFLPILIDSLERCDIYRSETGGASWHLWSSVANSQGLSSLAVDMRPPYYWYAAFYPYGVYRTSDGGVSWTNVSQGLSQTNVSSCSAADEKLIYAGVGNTGPEKTTDGGLTWQILVNDRSSEAGHIIVSRANPEIVYTNVYMNGGGLSVSTNGGVSWQTHTCPTCSFSEFAVGPDDLTFYASTLLGINNGIVIAGLAKSSDGGKNWTGVDLGIGEVNNIDQIVTDPLNGETVYASAWLRAVLNRNVLIKSTDGGNRWRELADSVASFCINQQNPRYLYYANTSFTNPGSFVSCDGGTTFQRISGGLQIKSVAADPRWENIAYALTWDGTVVVSTDSGKTWGVSPTIDQHAGLKSIQAVRTIDGGTLLLAETSMDGILSYKIEGPCSVSAPAPSGAQGFTLAQNYPNPFNPSTVISYHLPRSVFVTLKVYDVLGREVKTLIREQQNAGLHSIPFDASTLSSGIYFYRLLAGTFTETKKLTVLR